MGISQFVSIEAVGCIVLWLSMTGQNRDALSYLSCLQWNFLHCVMLVQFPRSSGKNSDATKCHVTCTEKPQIKQ